MQNFLKKPFFTCQHVQASNLECSHFYPVKHWNLRNGPMPTLPGGHQKKKHALFSFWLKKNPSPNSKGAPRVGAWSKGLIKADL